MATYGPCLYPKFKAFIPGTGNPLVGGLLYTCQPGTAYGPPPAFPRTTYTTPTGGGPNTNPVVLDANGEADIWIGDYTKLVLCDSTGALIWSVDNVPPNSDILWTLDASDQIEPTS